jgi:hypothetical protein
MSRAVTLVGYALIASALAAYEARARAGRRTAPLVEAVAALAGWRPGRWLLGAGWLWLGWHLFARSSGG